MPEKREKDAAQKDSQKAKTAVQNLAQVVVDPVDELIERIELISQNLNFISETDAKIESFRGSQAEKITVEEVLRQTGNKPNAPVEQRKFDEFFDRLTKIEDWFGEEEKSSAAKYAALKDLLARNLRDLTVLKVGKIQLEIYVVGLPAENILLGIKTKAVET